MISSRARRSLATLLLAGSLILTACGTVDKDPVSAETATAATVTSIDAQAAAAAEEAGIDAQVLAVDMDPREPTETIQRFMEYVDAVHVPAAIDEGAALSQRFGVAALSTLIIVDSDGQVTFRATDPDADTIVSALHKAGA